MPNKWKTSVYAIAAALILLLAFLIRPRGEDIFGHRYTRGISFDHWVGFPQWGCPLTADDIPGVTLDETGNLYLTLDDGSCVKAGQLTEYRPTKQSFDHRYRVPELGLQLKRRMVRRAYCGIFRVPWSDDLFFADVLQQWDGEAAEIPAAAAT